MAKTGKFAKYNSEWCNNGDVFDVADFWGVKVEGGVRGDVVEVSTAAGETKTVTLVEDFASPYGAIWSFKNGSVDLVAEAQIKAEREANRVARNRDASAERKAERTAKGFKSKKEEKYFYAAQRAARIDATIAAKGN